MFQGFRTFTRNLDGVTIHGRIGGSGPPLLLLHGYPQTHVMWHKVAPALAQHFTVVAADLRGYGASSMPAPVADHSNYSKRAMAEDMVSAMASLGFERFAVLAHDRGARVAHRLAMDAPARVSAMVLLDIAPTREMYANTSDGFARTYWHWFFLIQPAPLPELMIGADPRTFWLKKCGKGSAGLSPFTDEALEAYLTAFDNPQAIAASCEDYRAAASIDIQHDNEDGDRKVECPLLVLWGLHGAIQKHFDCLALWRLRAHTVSGESLPGGHYLAEELPEVIAARTISFLGSAST